jgi:hypothetical protein
VRRTSRRYWPTVVLMTSAVVLVVTDTASWLMYRAGYPSVYEYWLEGTIGPFAYGLVGLFITTRVAPNPVGPLMLGIPAIGALQAAAGVMAVYGVHQGWSPLALATLGGTFKAAQTVVVGLIILLLLLAPTGLPLNRFYRFVAAALVVDTIAWAAIDLLGGTTDETLRAGPSGISLAPPSVDGLLHAADTVAGSGALLALLLAAVGLAQRWWSSEGIGRRRVGWVVAGGLAGPAIIIGQMLLSPWLPPVLANGSLAWAAAGTMLPLGIAVAVLRHGLYELDRVVSRTVSYTIVTGFVVAVYVVVVALTSWLLPESSSLSVAAATLAAAAAFRPLLRRIQSAVDRRFDRARYDAAREVDAFGLALRTAIDPEQIRFGLVETIHRVLQPTSAVLWVRSGP